MRLPRTLAGFVLLHALLAPALLWCAEDLPKLHGTLNSAALKLASLVAPGSSRGEWYSEGQDVGPYKLVRILSGKVILKSPAGEEVSVSLVGATPVAGGDASQTPQLFSRKWINSKANPMLNNPLPIPREIARNWSKLTKEEREEVARFYLDHGWRILSVEALLDAGLTVEWENIYAQERKQVVQQNRTKFVASLSPEQKALWDQLNRPNRVVKAGADFSDAQKQEMARFEQLSANFRKQLSPSQESSRASIDDFTNGDW